MNAPDSPYSPPQTEPPPLPPEARFFTIGTILAILVIAFFVVLALLTPYSMNSDKEDGETETATAETEEKEEPKAQVNPLIEMQARMVVGISAIDNDFAISQARQLIPLANSPDTARPTAAVLVFLDRDEFGEQSLELLGEAMADRPVDNLIRQAINDPGSLSPENRQLLKDELGWTGSVVVASFDDAIREEILAEARDSMTVIAIFFLAAAAVIITGLVLFIIAIVKKLSGKLKFRLQPKGPPHGRFHFQAFALYLVGMGALTFAVGLIAIKLGFDPPLYLSLVVIFGAMLIGLSWPLIRGVKFGTVRRDIGLHKGEGFFKEFGCGLVGYAAITPIVVVGLLLTLGMQNLVNELSDGSAEQASHPAMEWLANPTWKTILVTFLIASVAAPIVEEIMFRGALHRGLRFRFGFVWTTLAACFIFAAVHPQGIVAVPGLMAVAFGLTLLREWRDSLIAPMVAHGVHNGAILTLAVMM